AFVARTQMAKVKWRRGVATAAVYFATLGIALSPWCAYGMRHFGKPFPSDNTRQVVRAAGGNVMDYYETPPPADLLQNPRKWIAGLVLVKAPRVAFGFYVAAVES